MFPAIFLTCVRFHCLPFLLEDSVYCSSSQLELDCRQPGWQYGNFLPLGEPTELPLESIVLNAQIKYYCGPGWSEESIEQCDRQEWTLGTMCVKWISWKYRGMGECKSHPHPPLVMQNPIAAPWEWLPIDWDPESQDQWLILCKGVAHRVMRVLILS